MSVITFDTIEYFDELITAGVPEAQAKAQVNVLKRAVTTISDGELATKVDLLESQNAVTADLKDLELKIEKRFVRLEVLMAIMLAALLLPTLKSLF